MTSYSPPQRGMIAISILIAGIFFALVVIFVKTFAQNVPMNDQVFYSVSIAVQGAEDDFSLSAILIKNNGNRLLWTNLITYAVAAFTQWDIVLESWVSLILAVSIFAILLKLATFDLLHALPLIIILFAALVFSLNQQFNWIWAPHNSSYFFVFFFLMAVLTIRQNEVGWQPLILSALLCFCSLFSLQQGFVSWPALVIVLLARGYRSWKFYVFWIVASLLSITLFTSNTSVGTTLLQAIFLPIDLIQWLTFILALLGTPIVTSNINFAAFIGFLLLMLLAANVIYLGFYRKHWLFVGTWVSLAAFSGAIAFLISLGRLELIGIERAGSSWYITHSLLIWYAVIAMSVESNRLIKQRLSPRRKTLKRFVKVSGTFLLIAFGLSYGAANFNSLRATMVIFKKAFGSDQIGIDELCRFWQPLTLTRCASYDTLETTKLLFEYEMAVFSNLPQLRLLPAEYQSSDIIVFDSQELDLHPFIDKIWFPNALDHLFHILPDNTIPDPQVKNILFVQNISKLMDESAEQLWYINANGNTNKTEFSERIGTHYVYDSESVEGRLQIIKYRRQ